MASTAAFVELEQGAKMISQLLAQNMKKFEQASMVLLLKD